MHLPDFFQFRCPFCGEKFRVEIVDDSTVSCACGARWKMDARPNEVELNLCEIGKGGEDGQKP